MRKCAIKSVSSLALAAVLASGIVGIDAASAKGKSDTIKPEPPSVEKGKSDSMPPPDPNERKMSVSKGKSNWIFPTMAALAVSVGVLVATGNGKPSSP